MEMKSKLKRFVLKTSYLKVLQVLEPWWFAFKCAHCIPLNALMWPLTFYLMCS